MQSFHRLNNWIGWLIFLIAGTVYIITSEPTASFWDCGEYIATAHKLQIGHPPGAPLFQLMGRFFSLFSFGDTALVARMINTMSAIASAFTILFLFWSITALSRKMIIDGKDKSAIRIWSVLVAGMIGSLSFTFSDSFWYSAVEGEVYAMSSCCTAFMFWAVLKWERVSDKTSSVRWLLLIAYLIGLSIGVHMLNLLVIPAVIMVVWFKNKPQAESWQTLLVFGLSLLALGFVMAVLIPGIVSLAGVFEIYFVNSFGFGFNTGVWIYFALLGLLLAIALFYTYRKKLILWNNIALGLVFVLIGYSSFFLLVLRSDSNTPIDENNPDNPIALLSYLNRDQYGDWPIVYGPYYNAPLDKSEPWKQGKVQYLKDKKSGKYIVVDDAKYAEPNYDKSYCGFFPRMHSQDPSHIESYKEWAGIYDDPYNEKKPTSVQNLRFFAGYQLNLMYLRYFMWNFAGRQNDIQGYGGILSGNFMTGIRPIDNIMIGPQKNLPEHLRNNKGRNQFYLLPLLLGLAGFFFHLNRNSKDAVVTGILFVMTGIAVVVYLNQAPAQPRERDYAYAMSFYAFAIWIGMGSLFVVNLFRKFLKERLSLIIAALICLLFVPANMAAEGWDDHDRSGRYTATEMAKNYLKSCEPNAILFTMGDNDTFPLWYVQEVEGFRTDVRVVNLSLLSTDWYIDQMRRKVYDSDPLPIRWEYDSYRSGKRDVIFIYPDTTVVKADENAFVGDLLQFAMSDDPRTKLKTQRGERDFFPSPHCVLPVDSSSVVSSGTVDAVNFANTVPVMYWTINDWAIGKNQLCMLEIILQNNWERPVYFSTTSGDEAYLGLKKYFQLDGLVYRLVPILNDNLPEQLNTRVNTSLVFDLLMNEYNYGNMEKEEVYLDETNRRMGISLRKKFCELAYAMIHEGKIERLESLVDHCFEMIPPEKVPYDLYTARLAEAYYVSGAWEKGDKLSEEILEQFEQELFYYYSLPPKFSISVESKKRYAIGVIQKVFEVTDEYGDEKLADKAGSLFMKYFDMYN